ncbi:ABC transporter substrate-binding protein [Sporomusa sp. KB1]|jgi:ABC-type Fe3+ transport system substrate-binding protein|uniref:ABC transporter substrate-binding protein n=1 Tax=Sporomusa sp. KB1 TaxID=943346 RepID=UPI0011A532E6|nr:ABC transporter substrate-binding protein [Sporomusa sp. KB1]TWH46494.1 ABC-type Fe3+ transport system substrate-binding protein [Sporomusa sp. KB1]
MDNLLECTIKEIVRQYPETLEVFINNGFALFAEEKVLNELGSILKLQSALRTKKIGIEAFMQLIKDKIEDTAYYNSLFSSMGGNKSGSFNIHIPCGLKGPLERKLQPLLQAIQKNDEIPHNQDMDRAPDLVLTKGYHFFNENFVNKFVNKGLYVAAPQKVVNKQLADLGIVDQEWPYNVICLGISVMVVDRKRLGDLPMPKTWGDLLKPEYERKVMINSRGESFSDAVLLSIYKEYGEAGIAALGRTIHSGSHSAQMIKGLASSNTDLPPIYIMPDFFAHTISSTSTIEIVWPEDGALVTPLFFMVKANKAEKFKELVDFLTGPQVGQICANAYFPSVHPDVSNRLPIDATFKWLGWDYIKEHDIEALIKKLNNWFLVSYRGDQLHNKPSSTERGNLAIGKA